MKSCDLIKQNLNYINLEEGQSVLVRKCLHKIAPSYLLTEFRHAHLFHGDNTRSRGLLRPPFAKTTKYQGSFKINGARTYNTPRKTGGHFACACVHPLNDNSVGTSNLMAGNRKLA